MVTLNIIYYRRDYASLLQEFVWSTDDVIPNLPRTHQFLWHWKNNIDAVVKEILMGVNHSGPRSYRSVDEILKLH